MRKDPTEGDRETVKARLLYLLRETGRSTGWIEAESQRLASERGWKPLTRGEVWRMAHGTRGIRPGLEKLGVIADVLGATFDFLARGKGAPFSHSDPPMRRVERELADLKQVVEGLRPLLEEKARRESSAPPPPHGRIRPAGGHIRAKR